jgi:hypothetical protein
MLMADYRASIGALQCRFNIMYSNLVFDERIHHFVMHCTYEIILNQRKDSETGKIFYFKILGLIFPTISGKFCQFTIVFGPSRYTR